jgi:hypothetical protein
VFVKNPGWEDRQRQSGRIGGLTFAARNDAPAQAQRASDAFIASFKTGHGGEECSVCPDRIDIPQNLPETERNRRAETLRRLHYRRLAAYRHRRRTQAELLAQRD